MSADVMLTPAALNNRDTRRAKYHWPDHYGHSRCGGLPLAWSSVKAHEDVEPWQKCRANGCRQQWIAREPDPGSYGAGKGFN